MNDYIDTRQFNKFVDETNKLLNEAEGLSKSPQTSTNPHIAGKITHRAQLLLTQLNNYENTIPHDKETRKSTIELCKSYLENVVEYYSSLEKAQQLINTIQSQKKDITTQLTFLQRHLEESSDTTNNQNSLQTDDAMTKEFDQVFEKLIAYTSQIQQLESYNTFSSTIPELQLQSFSHDIRQEIDVLQSRYKEFNQSSNTSQRIDVLMSTVAQAITLMKRIETYTNSEQKDKSIHAANEYMRDVDIQIASLKTDIDKLKSLPNTKETRSTLKDTLIEAQKIMDSTVSKLLELDKESHFDKGLTMRLCCTRLNQIQELQDEIIVTRIVYKSDKHTKLADPILNATDVGAALDIEFKKGNEEVVKSYIKLGTEAEDILLGIEGEKPSVELVKYQKALNSLLNDFDNTKVDVIETKKLDANRNAIKEYKIVVTTIDGEVIDIDPTKTIDNDLSKVQLTDQQLQSYEQYSQTTFMCKPETITKSKIFPTHAHFLAMENKFNMQADGSKITYPHKLAINVYTGDAYTLINCFVNGNIERAINSHPTKDPSKAIKEAIVHTIVCANALNKLDDYKSSAGNTYLWRGEGPMFQTLGAVEKHKRAVEEGGAYLKTQGFLSTAYDTPSSSFYSSTSPAAMLIKNCHGKRIIAWSQYQDYEREVLLPPTHLKIEAYKEVTLGQRKIVYFIAKPVKLDITKPIKKDTSKKAAQVFRKIRSTKKDESIGNTQEKI